MAIGPAVATAAARELTVWYDGDCPICQAEIGLMRRLDRRNAINFVDLSLSGACPTDLDARLARLHAQPRGGPVVDGAAAFVAMWRVLPSLRPLAVLASPAPVRWALERGYRLFLRVRPWLQAAARMIVARRAGRAR